MPVTVGTFLQFKIVQLNYTEVKYGMNMNISFFSLSILIYNLTMKGNLLLVLDESMNESGMERK